MGNEQSVPARRRGQNKLSKPRTNNNSSANLLSTKSAPQTRRNSVASISASPTKGRYSLLPVPVFVPEDNQKRDEKPKKRLSLFRSKSAQPKGHNQDAEFKVEDFSSDAATCDPRRWSKGFRGRESMIFESGEEVVESPLEMRPPPPRKRMSMSRPYENTNPRLSLVSELQSPGLIQVNTMHRPSEYEYEYEDEGIGQRLSRTPSEAEMYMPIRRRSLLQHGIATRTSYVEETQTCVPSSPVRNEEEFQNYYYNPTKPTSSPLAELAALERPPEFLPGPRVETPTEVDYGHIGAFKLGSLRITNGAASPVPSVERSLRRAATMGQEEDHITAGDAWNCHRHGLGQRSNTISAPAENQRVPWAVRAESPLRKDNTDTEKDSSQSKIRETHLEWNGKDYSPMPTKCAFSPLTLNVPDPGLALFNFNAAETLSRPTHSPTKSLELAHDYQQDILLSPFSFDNSPPVSPSLQVMSKQTAVDDDLFAPEPSTPEHSERFSRSFDSACEGCPPARTVKGPRDLTPKPLAKADSGYSSNVSLRSFKKEPTVPKKEAPPTPPKDTPRVASSTYTGDWSSRVSSSNCSIPPAHSEPTLGRAQTSRVPSSTYSTASTSPETSLRAQRSLPALPIEEPAVHGHPLRQSPPDSRKKTLNNEFPQASRNPNLSYQSTVSPHIAVPSLQSKRRSEPPKVTLRKESPASEVSPPSSRWSKRKSKRTQTIQTEPVYTVQAFRSPSEQLRIPKPSIEARRNLDKRVDQFPVASIADNYANQMPNTYVNQLGMRRSSSKETLGTIFSVGSVEVREELSFARLQSSLPAVPTQPTILEDVITVPVLKEIFSSKKACQRSYNNALPRLPPSGQSVPISSLAVDSDFNRKNTYQAPLPALPIADERTRMSMQPRTRERSVSIPRTQAEFETEITSFDGVSNSLGRSPYDVASTPRMDQRTKSITSQFVAEAAHRYARQRSVSDESNYSVIRPRMSYESISTGNPFLEHSESRAERNRGRPPQAHAKFNALKRQSSPTLRSSYSTGWREPSPANSHIGQQFGGWNEGLEEEGQVRSSLSQKTNSQDPVSMNTQRNLTPTSPGAHEVFLSYRKGSNPSHAQNRTTQVPAKFTYRQEARCPEWSQPADLWAERGESAGDAPKVHPRKSLEMRRPDHTPELRYRKSMDAYTYRHQLATQQQQAATHDLRARKSMDVQTYQQNMNGYGNWNGNEKAQRRSLGSSYRSFDNSQGNNTSGNGNGNGDGRKGWNVGVGYENFANSPGAQNQLSWVDETVRTIGSYQAQEYDHTYGTSSHHNKENFQHQQEYYDQQSSYSHSEDNTTYLPETIHRRNSCTSEMLVLDRFAGELDYEY
ncbi:hypothetical protein WAI453_011639 [Rhynchosporium graminicola]|uniref:Proteophosphoglycan ppg4 n=1 Tax=Rhynchosporium graminicola TaxID=2792576 RepID=A0A1E1LTE4_9HELO|nr:uncharacterized protein RCO7_07130 [Rhynchosporium commune]